MGDPKQRPLRITEIHGNVTSSKFSLKIVPCISNITRKPTVLARDAGWAWGRGDKWEA